MMERPLKYASFMAALGAGVVVGVLSAPRRRGGTDATRQLETLKRSLADLEDRMTSQQQAVDAHFREIDTRLDVNAAKLAEIPSTIQILDAIEQLLAKSMLSLDKRLTEQAASIELLRTKISHTDSVLERFFESHGAARLAPVKIG